MLLLVWDHILKNHYSKRPDQNPSKIRQGCVFLCGKIFIDCDLSHTKAGNFVCCWVPGVRNGGWHVPGVLYVSTRYANRIRRLRGGNWPTWVGVGKREWLHLHQAAKSFFFSFSWSQQKTFFSISQPDLWEGKKKALICCMCHFPWCKFFHQGRLQATILASLMADLGREEHRGFL